MKIVTILAIIFFASAAVAQTQYTVVVTKSGTTTSVDNTLTNIDAIQTVPPGAAVIFVRCQGAADCTKVWATQGTTPITGRDRSMSSVKFDVNVDDLDPNTAAEFKLLVGDDQSSAVAFSGGTFNLTSSDPTTNTPAQDLPLNRLLSNPCTRLRNAAAAQSPTDLYRDNTATIYVRPTGSVINRPNEDIDTNDTLIVYIIADEGFGDLDAIKISPSSIPGELNFIGDQLVDSIKLRSEEERPCREYRSVLRRFAAPSGVVEIRTATGEALKRFSIDVKPLYHGIFSAGMVRSEHVDQTFQVVMSAGKNVIASERSGDDELRYALFATPFWRPRAPERPLRSQLERVNFTVGVVPGELTDNGLAGISVDLGPVLFTTGVHAANTTILSPESKLKVGDEFTGQASEIPTATEWRFKPFVGMTLDLRVALRLFQNLLGTADGSAQ